METEAVSDKGKSECYRRFAETLPFGIIVVVTEDWTCRRLVCSNLATGIIVVTEDWIPGKGSGQSQRF